MSFWEGPKSVLESGLSLGREAPGELCLTRAAAGLCPAGQVRAHAHTRAGPYASFDGTESYRLTTSC